MLTTQSAHRFFLATLFSVLSLSSLQTTHAADIKLLSWNIESNRDNAKTADPQVIATQLADLQKTRGPYDLIALTEVELASRDVLKNGLNVNGLTYVDYITESGMTDRMMIFVRKDRFTISAPAVELEKTPATPEGEIQFAGGGVRRPFYVQLKDTQNDNIEFLFMVNHLERFNYQGRELQARGLREWARRQSLPIIAVGDYNFDFDFAQLTGNPAMSIFMRRDGDREGSGYFVWKWVIPDRQIEIQGTNDADRQLKTTIQFIDTNWYGKGVVDDFRDSVLDFVFVAQAARNWKSEAHVIVRPGDFPDNQQTSDHRPIEAILDPKLPVENIGGPIDK